MFNKYRKKPVVIEAIQWDGKKETLQIIADTFYRLHDHKIVGFLVESNHPNNGSLMIPTLEGKMEARHWDWIIKGIKNEFYPCKPDIFDATYEAVDD